MVGCRLLVVRNYHRPYRDVDNESKSHRLRLQKPRATEEDSVPFKWVTRWSSCSIIEGFFVVPVRSDWREASTDCNRAERDWLVRGLGSSKLMPSFKRDYRP